MPPLVAIQEIASRSRQDPDRWTLGRSWRTNGWVRCWALVKQQQAAHRGPPVALAGGGWVLLLLFPRSVKHQPLLICVVSSRSRGRAYSADGGPGGV